jgi:metal-responsive CopG/Arc/MetJ family transcriptional regulator
MGTPQKITQFLVRSPERLLTEIDAAAKQKSISRTKLINEILQDWTAGQQFDSTYGCTREQLKNELRSEIMEDYRKLTAENKLLRFAGQFMSQEMASIEKDLKLAAELIKKERVEIIKKKVTELIYGKDKNVDG